MSEKQPRKLSKADLDKMLPWAQKLHDRFAGDVEVQDIIEKLDISFQEIAEKPEMETMPKQFVINRAMSEVNTDITGIGNLKKISSILIGPSGRETDWSAKVIDNVQKYAKKAGKIGVYEMAKGTVTGIKVNEKTGETQDMAIAAVPITKEVNGQLITAMQPVRKLLAPMVRDPKDKKKWIVKKWLDKEETKPAYELWQDGDPVVPLDTEEKSGDGEKDNWNKGNALSPNWGCGFYLMIWESEKAKMPALAQFQAYGKICDPNSKDSIIEKISSKKLWLAPSILKAEINEKKSKNGQLFLKPGKNERYSIKPVGKDDKGKFSLYNFIMDNRIIGNVNFTGNPFDGKDAVIKDVPELDDAGKPVKDSQGNVKMLTPVFPLVDLEHLREYHEKMQTSFDSKTGKTTKRYNMIGAMECTLLATKDPDEKGGSVMVQVKDNSLATGRQSAFLSGIYNQLPFSEAADVLAFFQTTKKDSYYDVDIHDNVPDEDGKKGDISMNIIGMVVLMEHKLKDDDDEDAEEKEKPKSEEVEV